MAKDKSSPDSNQWLALKRADGSQMRAVLLRLLDRTVALHHDWHGACAYQLLQNQPFEISPEERGVITADILVQLRKGKLNFSREKAVCAAAACNLVTFVNEVHRHARVHSRQVDCDRRIALAKALRSINVDEIYERCHMDSAPTIIGPYTYRVIEALHADNSDDARAVLALMATRTTILSVEIKAAWPQLFLRVIEPILGERTFLKIAEPLFEPECLNKFRQCLEKPRREADALLGFGQFIPCSLESTTLLRTHHKGLAERQFGDDAHRDSWIERFNTLGEANAAGTLASLRSGGLRDFCHVMKESAVDKIIQQGGDFAYVDHNCRLQWRETLRELDQEFGGKISIWIVSGENESIFEERFGDAESIFFYTRSELALSATTRWPSGSIHIVQDPNAANAKLVLLYSIMKHGRGYTLGEFDRLLAEKGA